MNIYSYVQKILKAVTTKIEDTPVIDNKLLVCPQTSFSSNTENTINSQSDKNDNSSLNHEHFTEQLQSIMYEISNYNLNEDSGQNYYRRLPIHANKKTFIDNNQIQYKQQKSLPLSSSSFSSSSSSSFSSPSLPLQQEKNNKLLLTEQYHCQSDSFTIVQERATKSIALTNKNSFNNENNSAEEIEIITDSQNDLISDNVIQDNFTLNDSGLNDLIINNNVEMMNITTASSLSVNEVTFLNNMNIVTEEENDDEIYNNIDYVDDVKDNKEIKFSDQYNKLEASFPYPVMREPQKIICEKLKLCDDKRYIVIEAMPGVGKSGIAHMIAYHFNSAYILTATKVLQDQYASEFPKMSIIKGKANYTCGLKRIACNFAECVENPVIQKTCRDICPFYIAKDQALTNNVTVTSYAYFLTWLTSKSSKDFTPRKVLICDEAHLLDSYIIDWAAIILNLKQLNDKYHINNNMNNINLNDYSLDDTNISDEIRSLLTIKNYTYEDGFSNNNKNYIYSIYILLNKKQDLLTKSFNLIISERDKNKKELYKNLFLESGWDIASGFITEDIKSVSILFEQILTTKVDESLLNLVKNILNNFPSRTVRWKSKRWAALVQLKEDLSQLIYNLNYFFDTVNPNEWIIYTSEAEDKTISLNIKPLHAANIFHQYVEHYGIQHVIFMSATILSAKLFCEELGIKQNEVGIIHADSTFDPKKSPIYYYPIGEMSYKNFINTNLKNILINNLTRVIIQILHLYPNQKGIIHTGNYNIASIIITNINNNRLLMRKLHESNEQLLQRHAKSTNSVLVSPSLNTGADLKDDLSRFQIIVKLPFISLGDKAVKYRASQDSDWYVCDMLKTLIQACGRSTRSSDDYSITYILDASFYQWVSKYNRWLPQSFLNRIIWNVEDINQSNQLLIK